MPSFKKIPVTVQAERVRTILTALHDAVRVPVKTPSLPGWVANAIAERTMEARDISTISAHLVIKTLEGEMKADLTDWVIQGVAGEIYPCKGDIFQRTFEPAEGSSDHSVIVLDRYERDNLLALLHLVYHLEEGPRILATGDWTGQLYWKLAPEGYSYSSHNPNVSPESQLQDLRRWLKG